MFKFLKGKETFSNVAKGKIIDITEIPDPIFSGRVMGDGYGVIPSDGKIYAPISGNLSLVFPTGHAFGITSDAGAEILIHVGIDTVELEGKGFNTYVQQNANVKKGDLLVEVDLDQVEAENKSTVTAVIFTSGEKVTLLKQGESVDHDTEGIITYK